METLMRTTSKIVLDIKTDCFLKEADVNKHKVCVFKLNQEFNHVRFLYKKQNFILPICSSSSQANFETEIETQLQETNQSRTVHVKFQLKSECLFGEQYFIVGDHLILGSWDPENAIPLNWSDGHIWSVEMDLPIEEPIQFKFILKDTGGDIEWQPGPDRVIQAWETDKTITVCEDWDNVEYQKILEEDPLAAVQNDTLLVEEDHLVGVFQNEEDPPLELFNNDSLSLEDPLLVQNETPTVPEMLIVAENVSNIPTPDVNQEIEIGDNAASTMEIPMVADNIMHEPEQQVTFVAENVETPIKEPESNASNETLGKSNVIPAEVAVIVPSKTENMMVAENVLGSNGSATSPLKDLNEMGVKTNLITQDEFPVLVPGLSPSSISPNEKIKTEDEKTTIAMVDPTLGVDEAMNENFTEKQELGDNLQVVTADISNHSEDQQHSQLYNERQLAQENQWFSELFHNNVLKTDFRWGRKTIQKFLTNLGLLKM